MGKDGSYFQPVQLTETTVLPSSDLTITNGLETLITADQKTNAVFWTKRLAQSLNIEDSELVFVGYGVVAPEYGWDDYADLDVSGKTVVMLVNDPGFATKDDSLFKGNSMTYYGRWTYKYEEAGRQGAAAAIVIHETAPASYGWDVVSGSWTGAQYDLVRPDGGASRTLVEGWLHKDAAQTVFSAANLDYDAMKTAALTQGFKPVPMGNLKLSATLNQKIKTVESRNVAGGIIGTEYPDEYVLYMGHWDHIGINPNIEGDNIWNGAVDNATGTAAIIEIGEAFVQQGAPKRSAIIVAVTAEESGLLGSAYYAEDPLVPLENTVAGINIDAILPLGRTKDMIVVGHGASELEDRLNDVLKPRDLITSALRKKACPCSMPTVVMSILLMGWNSAKISRMNIQENATTSLLMNMIIVGIYPVSSIPRKFSSSLAITLQTVPTGQIGMKVRNSELYVMLCDSWLINCG